MVVFVPGPAIIVDLCCTFGKNSFMCAHHFAVLSSHYLEAAQRFFFARMLRFSSWIRLFMNDACATENLHRKTIFELFYK